MPAIDVQRKRYYAIEFTYPGKATCIALSADFLIHDDAAQHEIEEMAYVEAEKALLDFYKRVFPDSVYLTLVSHHRLATYTHQAERPEIKIIPGTLFLSEDDQAN